MRFTFSKLFLVSTLAAAAAIASLSARAESVNVPFEFTAQGHSFPSGDYAVEQSPAKHLVILHQVKGNAVLNWSMGAGAESEEGHIQLNFRQSENGMHILKSVQYGRRFAIGGSPFQHAPGNQAPMRE